MTKHRIYTMSFASVYPHYIAKAEKKGRTKAEVDEIIRWLTGYSQDELEAQLAKRTDFETFFAEAPRMNPARALIKGVVCGVRVEDIEEPLMREIRYLDKLIDELAKGMPMAKTLRTPAAVDWLASIKSTRQRREGHEGPRRKPVGRWRAGIGPCAGRAHSVRSRPADTPGRLYGRAGERRAAGQPP